MIPFTASHVNKDPIIWATSFFHLSRNVVALQVETLCCTQDHVCDQLVSQQNTVLKVCEFYSLFPNRPFSHSTSVLTNNSTRARLGWTFSYIYCIFFHPDLDSALLFVGMRERSIAHNLICLSANFALAIDVKFSWEVCIFPREFHEISLFKIWGQKSEFRQLENREYVSLVNRVEIKMAPFTRFIVSTNCHFPCQ